MKQLVALSVLLSLLGCAGRGKPNVPTEPVNGRCGVMQDVCVLGTPSDTGDTTPPYGWMCLGRNGGTNDTCSVPTARIEEDEVFAGQKTLEEKVKAVGPLRGKMVVLDPTTDSDDPTHALAMRADILDMGVPEEVLVFTADHPHKFLTQDTWRETREETLVIAHPTSWAADLAPDYSSLLPRLNILHVAAAGNPDTFGNRDLWYPEHPHWEEYPGKWESVFSAFATGKIILAAYAGTDSRGNVVPFRGTARCGEAKDVCFSVILPGNRHRGSSSASVRLGALTFYLSQLWDTPQEVVHVLNVCAEDVGEPGIDEEFGRGIASVVCDTVQSRERSAVASSLHVSHAASPVLSQMTAIYGNSRLVPQSLSVPSLKWFRPFYAVRGHDLETITGHVGGQFSLNGSDLFVSTGTGYTPLGVYSSLRRATRIPFIEFGTKRTLVSRGGHAVSLLGTYGYSEGDGLPTHLGHLGAQYGHRLFGGTLSLYAGHQIVRGLVGIPGYREARADPVPFTDRNRELRVSFSLVQ